MPDVSLKVVGGQKCSVSELFICGFMLSLFPVSNVEQIQVDLCILQHIYRVPKSNLDKLFKHMINKFVSIWLSHPVDCRHWEKDIKTRIVVCPFYTFSGWYDNLILKDVKSRFSQKNPMCYRAGKTNSRWFSHTFLISFHIYLIF